MIRKQIYIGRRHEAVLKRLSRLRKVSAAEIIRQAIDRQMDSGAAPPSSLEPEAWEDARRFMRSLQKKSRGASARRWRREDAYTERLK